MTRVPQLFYVVVFALACAVVSAADDNRFTTRINFRKCKLTHTGIEYQGNVFTTQSKSLCRTWDSIGVRDVSTNNIARQSSVLFEGMREKGADFERG